MKELEQYIISHFNVTEDNIAKLATLFTKTSLKKGDYFNRKGQYCEKLSIVKSGYIRFFANDHKKEITQWISSQGQFITDLYSFTFKQRSRWNIQAITNCELYTIDKENYTQINSYIPNWPEIEKQFIAGCFVELENRVFRHLSLNAEERYDQFFENNKELLNQVPLQYLASMLGMSPETFSRIRKNKIS